MKKRIYLIAICAVVITACGKEEIVTDESNQEILEEQTLLNPVTLTFEADPSAKVSIDAAGTASWEEGDRIQIISFDANGEAKSVVSNPVTIVDGVGRFTATVEDSEEYYSVYPHTLETSLTKVDEEDLFTVKFDINGIAASKFSDAAYYAAKTTKKDATFAFKAITTILKVTTALPDVQRIFFRPYSDQLKAITGNVPVSFDAEGNVTVGIATSTQASAAYSIDGAGTYYLRMPANGTQATAGSYLPGFILRIGSATDYLTGAAYYPAEIALTRGKIYTVKGNIEDKLITDYYVSPNGTGDGLSEESPISFAGLMNLPAFVKGTKASAMMQDGVTIHFAGGTYYSPFGGPEVNSNARTLTYIGSTEANNRTVFTTTTSTIFKDSNLTANIENIDFSGCSSKPALQITLGKINLKGCNFTLNTARAASFGKSGSSDDNLQVNCINCLFKSNSVLNSGIILAPSGASGGVIGFHNCRFEANVATEGKGSVIYTITPVAMFLNKCTFIYNKATTPYQAYTIEMNSSSTRLGMNCCTVNAGTPTAYDSGMSILIKGAAVISNSTVWTSKEFGKWGLIAQGHYITDGTANSSSIINSVIRQNGTTYPPVYLDADYYQNLEWCLFSGAGMTVTEGVHTITNSENVVSFDSAAAKNKVVDGIEAYYYAWNFNKTVTSFTKPTADQVRSAISGTGESTEGAADGIGRMFLSWLDSIDPDAFTKDLIGTARPQDGLCPGSVEN